MSWKAAVETARGADWAPSLCSCRGGKTRTTDIGWDWSCVDQVYCINLRDRLDRFVESMLEFHNVGLCDRIVYYRPERPSDQEWDDYQSWLKSSGKSDIFMTVTKGAYGCWKSHKTIAEHALQHGHKRILVFEDDVEFLSNLSPDFAAHTLPNLIEDLPENAEFLHLGYFPFSGFPVIGFGGKSRFGQLWSVQAVCTVAYMATEKGMEKLRDANFTIPLDFWMIQNTHQYAAYPKIAWQRQSPTDVQEEWAGCSSTSIKEIGNKAYRNSQTPVDTFLIILLPIMIVALCLFFFAYFFILVKNLRNNTTSSSPAVLQNVPGTPGVFSLTQTFGIPVVQT